MQKTYASLWRRALAFGVDYLVIAAYLVALVGVALAAQWLAPGVAGALFGNPVAGELSGFLLITLPVSLYFALAEAGTRQGTWGKQRLAVRVQRLDGARLSLGRSLARTALKFVPWELAHFCIWQITFSADPSAPIFTAGFGLVWALVLANAVSVLLSPRRQALYDWLTGNVVVHAQPPGKPT